MKDTNLKRYGVDNAMKNSVILNKVKRTCIMKYGTENPMQNIDVQNSLKFSLISKYSVDNISKTKYWKNLIHNNKDLIQQKRYNTCKKNNLYLFLDGARLAVGLDKSDITLADLAQYTDVYYIGGTKNGALLGEAVVISNEDLKKNFRFSIKQNGGMYAKGYVTGIQFLELLDRANLQN